MKPKVLSVSLDVISTLSSYRCYLNVTLANIFLGVRGLFFVILKSIHINMWHLCIVYAPVQYASPQILLPW